MKLYFIKNKILPFGKHNAIALYPCILYKGNTLPPKTIAHEKIHIRQQLELGIIPFYILYIAFHIIYGYQGNPFEKEAYKYENDDNYLKQRRFCNRR